MSLKRSLRLVSICFGLLLAPIIVLAADCPATDTSSWASAAQTCAALTDRQGCYAAGTAQFTLREEAPADLFSSPGSIGIVTAIKSVQLGPDGLFAFQTAGHLKKDDVTIVLFGNVSLEDQRNGKFVAPTTPTPTSAADAGTPGFTLQGTTWFDGTILKKGTGLLDAETGKVPLNTTVTIDGRDNQNNVHVIAPDGSTGWTSAPMFNLPSGDSVDTSPDFSKLPILATGAPLTRTGPFSRMTFTGAPCPGSGMVIQSPKDGDHARFTINGHTVLLGSTLYIYEDSSGNTVYMTVEGTVVIYLDDGMVIIPAGTEVRVAPDGTVSDVHPYDIADIWGLPIDLFPDGFVPAPPLTPDMNNPAAEPPVPGVWSLDIYSWGQSGDCDMPAGALSAIGEIYQQYVWDGDPSKLIDYWTSGEAQAIAEADNIHFDFAQPAPNTYVFTAHPNDTDTLEVTFTHPSESFIPIFASLHTGATCVIKAQALMIYSGPE